MRLPNLPAPVSFSILAATLLFLVCGGTSAAATPEALSGPKETATAALTPAQAARLAIRTGKHTGTSRGLAMGYVQCNLVILPKAQAYDFLLYCQRNQRACPVIEVLDTGSWEPK